ncbi:MAG: LamB/YcsF family protein, partial [Gemmataceae bacterium]|nr:LamB/YcsF family protein [Gemmataceae bacterium]
LARTLVGIAEYHGLHLLGLPGSELQRAARGRVEFVAEGFADRRYRPDGTLVPRTDPNPFVHDPQEVVTQVEWLVRERGVRSVCVHGDNPDAVAFARAIRAALVDRGFVPGPFA